MLLFLSVTAALSLGYVRWVELPSNGSKGSNGSRSWHPLILTVAVAACLRASHAHGGHGQHVTSQFGLVTTVVPQLAAIWLRARVGLRTLHREVSRFIFFI